MVSSFHKPRKHHFDVCWTVVSLLIVNSDTLAVSEFATAFQTAGVDTLAYSPPSASLTASSWPTLGTLIDAGTRLVAFMASGADFTTVPYIIDGATTFITAPRSRI